MPEKEKNRHKQMQLGLKIPQHALKQPAY